MKKKNDHVKRSEFTYGDSVDMRTILLNAIKMQALYSGRKIRVVDTSKLLH